MASFTKLGHIMATSQRQINLYVIYTFYHIMHQIETFKYSSSS